MVHLAVYMALLCGGGVHLCGHFCFSEVEVYHVLSSGEKVACQMDWFLVLEQRRAMGAHNHWEMDWIIWRPFSGVLDF